MKVTIFASLIVGAAAFAAPKKPVKAPVKAVKKPAPKPVARKPFGKTVSFANEVGAQVPLGFWDPLGLVADGDKATFDRLRYVEVKHGRISMLAVAGYLTTAGGLRLPGDIDLSGDTFASIPSGFAALSAVPAAGIFQIVAFIAFLEFYVMKDIVGGEFPGDFRNGFIDFGWDTFDAETKLKKRAIELNNGRAAQMGILALMVHDKLDVPILPYDGLL